MTGQQKSRFAIIMVGVAFALVFTYREDVLGSVLSPLTHYTARTTLVLLHLCGMEAARAATLIFHPDGFAYEIYYRCTGFLPVAILTAAIFAYPGPWRSKFFGLAIGVPVLLGLNLFRLVYLFYVGVYMPAAFDFAHSVLGESLWILATLGIWLAWIKWSERLNVGGSFVYADYGDAKIKNDLLI
jgi:exosortase H (IPTLxxWG-CTERM-specific)